MIRFVVRPFAYIVNIALNSFRFNNLLSNLLPRFAALIAIFTILIPTFFILPAEKVSASEAVSSYVADSPERFQISDFRFQISDFRFQISDFRFQISEIV